MRHRASRQVRCSPCVTRTACRSWRPWRNAAIAAWPLMRKSWPIAVGGSRTTRTRATRTVWMPANKSGILAGWPALRAALVSAMRIGITGQLAYGHDGRPEYRNELPGRLEVVAVDPHPVHVRTAGPPGSRAGNLAMLRLDDVDRPQPGHVLGSDRAEESDDVPPCGNESRRGCGCDSPRRTRCRSFRGRSPE